MSRGGGDKAPSFEERMETSTDPQEQLKWAKLIIKCQANELDLAGKYIKLAYDSLNADLKQGDKCKGSLIELASRVAGMAKTAGGLYLVYKAKEQAARDMLATVIPVEPRDAEHGAIEARYRLQHQAIVLESLERKEIK
jgi:hypothetical protein